MFRLVLFILSIVQLSRADVIHAHSATASQHVDGNGVVSSITSLTSNKNGVISTISRNFTNQISQNKPSHFSSSSFNSIKPINQNILPPKTGSSATTTSSLKTTKTPSTTQKISKINSTRPPRITTSKAKLTTRTSSEYSSKVLSTKSPSKPKKNIDSSGKYVPEEDKWAYKPDKSGKYQHVHVPYNGGYGPWTIKKIVDYDHDGRPYEHDDHPFNNQFYNDKKPAVYREYGAPLFSQH